MHVLLDSLFHKDILLPKWAKKITAKIVELFFSSVVFAVIASLLTTAIINKTNNRRLVNQQLSDISNIYIGCSKMWSDERFGCPQFTAQEEDYLLCAYVSDYFVIQMVFDESLSAQAYLITALRNSEGISLHIYDETLQFENDLILSQFSYYDFPAKPQSIFGFVSQGNARAFYGESYYYNSFGNYYNYHIASFDYGDFDGYLEDFISQFDLVTENTYIDDEVTPQLNSGLQIITDRHNNCPNTYGVSNLNIDINNLLFTYDWFNSQQLRNKLNQGKP